MKFNHFPSLLSILLINSSSNDNNAFSVNGFAPTISTNTRTVTSNVAFLPTTIINRKSKLKHTKTSLNVEVNGAPASIEDDFVASEEGDVPTTSLSMPQQNQIFDELRKIQDPDLNQNIVDLNFVQNVAYDVETQGLQFDLCLTTPACPIKEEFVSECESLLMNLDFIKEVDVNLTSAPLTPLQSTGDTGQGGLNIEGLSQPQRISGLDRVSNIVAVSSCKGGVGKSTTTINLAFALSALGAKVGIWDVDLYGPSLPTMVEPENDEVFFIGNQIAPLQRSFEGGVHPVKLMSFGYINDDGAVMRGPMITQLLEQFLSLTNWGELDYLLLDFPPGTGDIQLTLSQKLNIDAAVIVTTPTKLSFVDVVKGIEMMDGVEVPCVAVVENMSYYEQPKAKEVDYMDLYEKFVQNLESISENDSIEDRATALVEIVSKQLEQESSEGNNDSSNEQVKLFGSGHKDILSNQYGIEHTFSFPLLPQVAANGDNGIPFMEQYPKSKQASIYTDLAKTVAREVAKIKFSGKQPRVTFDAESYKFSLNDGDSNGFVSSANLRRACRCAYCVEELTGRQILDVNSIPETIVPLKFIPTGNYALSIEWSDGHRSLYPYRAIRELLTQAS